MSTAEALAFDMYSTLVNPIRIWKLLEQYVPNDAVRVVEVWRQKQLEFTFRLTTMERYEDFEQVTRKALDYALALVGQQLNADQKNVLMAQYNDLERFPDVEANRQVNAVWMGSRRDTRLCQTPTRAPARGRPGSLHDKSANAFT